MEAGLVAIPVLGLAGGAGRLGIFVTRLLVLELDALGSEVDGTATVRT